MRKIAIAALAVCVLAAVVAGVLYYARLVDDYMTQTNLVTAIRYAFCFERWRGGASQLSDDHIGALAAKLDYDKYGASMSRNAEGCPLDVWGHPFQIRARPMQDEAGVYVLEVRSAGPDGVMGTDDDLLRKEYIPVVYYIFSDRSDPAVIYDFALVGMRFVARKVDLQENGQVSFYVSEPAAVALAEQSERWKAEVGEEMADGTSEEGALIRTAIPADEMQPVQKVRFPNRIEEYKEFLGRLRQLCVQETLRKGQLPMYVLRDKRLTGFLKVAPRPLPLGPPQAFLPPCGD